MTLSVTIITKNAARTLERCLQSVAWADEIVVVDSNSTDRTAEICHQYAVRLINTLEWHGFGFQKNLALQAATGEWVLSIDADEWLTPDLIAEIKHQLAQSHHPAAFAMPRLSSFCGRNIHHSGWWPDYVVRLFIRTQARFSDDVVHEHLIANGEVRRLKNPIRHETMTDLDQALDKLNRYSTASAQSLYQRGRRANLWTALSHGLWAFIRTYFLHRGFLDGTEGFLLAITNAEGSYYRYVKLMQLHRQHQRKTTDLH